MDLRQPVVGILVGGSPAPGINGVISAAAIEAISNKCMVVGFNQGWKKLRYGISSQVVHLTTKSLGDIQFKGGSFLRTSKDQLNSPLEVDNALRALQHHRVRYLITIGGTDTAFSSRNLHEAAKSTGYQLSVVHVPKTIFSDLPLPEDAKTFGYSTAREVGSRIILNLMEDARTMIRWYIEVVIGAKAGHLCLGIGKSSAATLTIIPEEYEEKVSLDLLVDLVESCMIKREALGTPYGVVLLTEGLVDKMDPKQVQELFGSVDKGHDDLSRVVSEELTKRFAERKKSPRIIPRCLGFELRCADPNATDRERSRELGYGAASYVLSEREGGMVSIHGGELICIPFADLLDEKTGKTQIKRVDTNALPFRVAEKYMVRLRKSDLEDDETLYRLAKVACLSQQEFIAKFKHVAC